MATTPLLLSILNIARFEENVKKKMEKSPSSEGDLELRGYSASRTMT